MKHCTCIMITTALLGALTANAQNWTFVDENYPSPAMITNAAGWKFEMEEDDWWGGWTITKCVGAPASPGFLNLAAPIYDENGTEFDDDGITSIEGSSLTGGVLGAYRDKATGLVLPDTLCYIGNKAFYGCDSLAGMLEIPDSVVEFGYWAFYGTGFETIVMPSTGVFSDDETFAEIASLKAVHFTGGYPHLGVGVFLDTDNVIFYIRAENESEWNPHVSGGPVSGGNATWYDHPIRIGSYGWHLDASATPAAITNLFGWRFSVTVNGSNLTLTDCTAAPDFPRLLPLHEPVNGGYSIVNITSPRTSAGGILGAYCDQATGLTLPDTLTNIGNYAFYSCPSLWGALFIPNAVTNIGNYAFQNCSGFDNWRLAIPDSVTAIGNNAFQNCTGFDGTLVLGNAVQTIGDYAFDNCSRFSWTPVLGNAVQTIGNYAFYHCTGFSGTLIIPDSVTGIGNGAFYDTRIQQIFTPSAGVTFGQMAFANNPALLAIHYAGGYPASVGSSLYNGSSSVTSYVTAGNAADWQSKFGGTGTITDGNAIWRNQPLRTFDYDWHYVATPSPAITNALGWRIQVSVYSPTLAVRELTLTNCAAAPAFPSPLPLANPIQGGLGIYSIVNIAGQNVSASSLLGPYTWQVSSLTLPDTLVGIGDYSFDSCYYLTGPLAIPNSVTWIGHYAFNRCYGLTGTLTIPDSVEGIGDSAFDGCDGFEGLSLGNSVQDIGDYAFSNCSRLTGTLTIPDSVNKIGDWAFSGTRLQEIFTPSTYVWFGEGVFSDNPSLTAVHYLGWYPNDVGESIYEGSLNAVSYVRAEYAVGWDGYAFGEIVNGPISGGTAIWRDRPIRIGPYDWHLDASTSPAAITNFFGWRFSVTVNGSDLSLTACTAAPAQPCPLNFAYPVSGGYQIVNITGSVTPGGILNTRANKATWLTLPDTLTNIGNYAFYLMGSSLKGSLVIPNTVTNIGSGAFQACSGFDQLSIGSSVTAIGTNAFANCSNLSGTLTIPDSVTDIGNSAFANCSNLSGTLTIPDSVTHIGNSAFNNTGIRQIFSPSAGVTFGQNVFANNPALLAVHYAGGYPASVGGALYNGSSNVISYVTVGNAANWQTNFGADGGTGSITGGTAIWQGQPLRTFNYDWHYVNTTPLSITNALGWTFTVAVSGNSSPYDITIRKCTAAPAFPSPLPLANPVANNALGVFRIVNITSDSGSDNILVPYADQASSLTLPDTLLNIGNWAFGHYCSKLTGPLVIPNAVTNIGTEAFFVCGGLTGPLTLPNSVKTIGDSAFAGCIGLTGPLTLPNSLTRIEASTFTVCGFTGPLNIPNTVTNIGASAFAECSDFTGTLVIPSSVTAIEDGAFSRCPRFTGLTMAGAVASIGDYAFIDCSGLTGTLVIPNSVHEIGSFAFRGTSFTQIFTPSTGVAIGVSAFGYTPTLTAVYYTGNYPSYNGWEDWLQEWLDLYYGAPNVTSYVTTGNAANWQSNFGADGGTGSIAGGTGKWQGCPIRTYAQNITVSFDGNGAWNGPFTDKTVQISLSYGVLPDPQRTGHNTPVWTLNGEPVTSATTVTATTNHTLTAQWTANTYTVVFNAGSGGSASPYAQVFTYGTPAELMPNTFTRDGFTFVGWRYYGNNTFYTDGATVLNLTSMQNGTVALFAQWVPDGLIGEGVMVTQISMSPKGEVMLQWAPEKAYYIVYVTDDLTRPVAQWIPFTADHPFHPILINSEYDGAELSRDALVAAGLDPDRLFFHVRVVE